MKPHTLLTFVAIILFFSSCGLAGTKCRGVHKIHSHSNIEIESEDTIAASNGNYNHIVSIAPIITTTEGDRSGDCLTKEYVVAYGDLIDSATLKVICDRNLYWYNKRVINAGDNLLNVDIYKSISNNWDYISVGGMVIEIEADSVETGTHNFIVTCTTKQGKDFSDTVAVYYR